MTLRVLRRVVALTVMRDLAYRGDFALFMFNQIVGPTLMLLVWLTVSAQGVALPYARTQLVGYYVLLGLVSALTASWIAPYVAEPIRRGTISGALLRPVPYIIYNVGDNIGQKLLMVPLLLPQLALVALVFRSDLRLPADPLRWLLFAVAVALAAATAFLLDFCVGSLAFWLEDTSGVERVVGTLGELLSGRLVPLAFFAPALAPLLAAQPFRFTLAFPLEVLTGTLTQAELRVGFALQCGYALLFYALYRLIWRYGLRAYAAAGA